MADGMQRSFESMSLNRAAPGQQQGQLGQHFGLPSPSNGTLSSQNSSSVRSPASTYGTAPQHVSNGGSGDGQSAAARFERFFNSGSPQPQGLDTGAQHSAYAPQQPSPASVGPGSSAAGLATSGAFSSFGHNFGAGGAASSLFAQHNSTVPALRTKPSTGARHGIPSQWNTGPQDDLTGSSPPRQHFGGGPGLPASFFPPPGTAATAFPGVANTGVPNSFAGLDDDIIPTAIVVKNIPFSIKREQLLQIIEDLQIPMPYAFNYHFDQGVFRGLAFANFRSGEEADAVVAALNGFDVSGRKLRVEYKKVLQAGEKERIEKEKAIKRMQSMQMEKERARRQTVGPSAGEEWNAQMAAAASMSPVGVSNAPISAPPASISKATDPDSGYGDAYGDGQTAAQQSPDLLRSTLDSQPDLAAGAAAELGGRKEELDLNDPATLEIYSRVLLFKDDRMRDELSFSKNLTTNERRIVHMVSKKLHLYHYSIGESEERYVIVTKNEVNQPQRPLRSQASTIGRSQRGAGNGGGEGSGPGGVGMATGANGLMVPGSSYTVGRNALRTKKSAPDMKRQRERSDDAGAFNNAFGFGVGSGGGSGTQQHGLYAGGLSRKSNGNLREGYSSSVGRRSAPSSTNGAAGLQSLFSSPFDIPPVPALPLGAHDNGLYSSSPSPIGTIGSGSSSVGVVNGSNTANGGSGSTNGSMSGAVSSQHVLRQPAGPGAANRNFAQRSRVPIGTGANGHTSVASDHANGGVLDDASNDGPTDAHRFGGPGDLRDDDVQSHQPLEV